MARIKKMTWEREEAEPEIDEEIDRLAAERGTAYAAIIRAIVYTNLVSGRALSWINSELDGNPRWYVRRVVGYYDRWGEEVNGLQVEQRHDLWTFWYDQIVSWTRIQLRNASLRFGIDSHEQYVDDCASMAAIKFLQTPFPSDVDLQPWIVVIIRHTCLKYLHRLQGLPEESLDHPAVQIADEDADPIDLTLVRQMVLDAIAQLSEQDQEIIRLRAFENLSARDVAERLRITEGTVNKRFHDAKQRLRKILGPGGDI